MQSRVYGLEVLTLSNIKIIVAVDANGGFGYKGKIPWYYKEDFAFFKQQTAGSTCVMGRHTYNEINDIATAQGRSQLLPGRKCYVVSNTLDSLPNAEVIRTVADVNDENVFVIGGQRLYNDALNYTSQIYLTRINKSFDCDVFFNMKYVNSTFEVVKTFPSQHTDLTFSLLERK